MSETTTTGLSAILTGTETVITLVGNVFTLITSNPLLCVFAAVGLLGVGVGVFKMLKRASR